MLFHFFSFAITQIIKKKPENKQRIVSATVNKIHPTFRNYRAVGIYGCN